MMSENLLNTIADAMSETGCIILDHVLPEDLLQQLAEQARALNPQEFKTAGVGRDQVAQRNAAIRNDEIVWIEAGQTVGKQYLDWMEQLRTGLNQRLFMGLFDYESHYAHYAPGAFYKKHLDAFHGETNRVLTTVLYLNHHWPADAGGELVIYAPDSNEVLHKVTPEYGRLIIFLSEKFPHEVKPAHQDRYSIAGWFRVNTSTSKRVNPA